MKNDIKYRKIIYPGSFDPITNGHTDLIERASKMFDEVIVAIASNAPKKNTFSIHQRVELAKRVLKNIENVIVCSFDGLLVNFLIGKNINIVLRGLRAVSDFEYEIQLASVNRKLFPEIETVFLTPSEQFTYISSSLVKQISELGGDVSAFVAPEVNKELTELYRGDK
ncbi:MAG: pantetheine-phosphate adenylyltransferase [Legionellales bacterium]|nr:pantetheine-phosphate adenylyltransferase [Legionellales bacterium]